MTQDAGSSAPHVAPDAAAVPPGVPLHEAFPADPAESRNIAVLAAHQVVHRIAWVFKTESVIMPAFLDAISGQAWVRGVLPILNNIGQSVPPLLLSHRIAVSPRKKWVVAFTTILMGAPFLLLGATWAALHGERPAWLPPLFLALYTVFFAMNGVNVVAFATLQGKLIRPERRGRLMGLAGGIGAVLSIAAAWIWLGTWLALPDGGYAPIFLFTGIGFAASGATCAFVAEPASRGAAAGESPTRVFAAAWQTLRTDAPFRRLAIAAMLCICAQLLFPHYQALGRERLGLKGPVLMHWVIAQNLGTGVFSSIFGGLADRRGNRLSLQAQAILSAATPLLALYLALVNPALGAKIYWVAFLLLGLTPVTMRTLLNYVLELTPPGSHPRSVSTLRLCMALPLCLGPFLGGTVDSAGFVPTFLFVATMLAAAGWWCLRLPEPRAT